MKFKKVLVIFLMAFFIVNIERPVFAFNGDNEVEAYDDINSNPGNQALTPESIIFKSQLVYDNQIMVGPPPNLVLLNSNPEREKVILVKNVKNETIIRTYIGPQDNEFSHGSVVFMSNRPEFYDLLNAIRMISNFDQCCEDFIRGYTNLEDENFSKENVENYNILKKCFNKLFDIWGV